MRAFHSPVAPATDAGISSTAPDARSVARAYARLAWAYDWIFGTLLHAGRRRALGRLPIAPGDDVLEVGVGTGLTLPYYPRHCAVIGGDLSGAMLGRAAERVTRWRLGHVRLMQMDATHLPFADESFAAVYAAYVVSTVPDPVAVVAEMGRVCRPGGHVVLLNHFRSEDAVLARLERLVSPLTVHAGFAADLDRTALIERAGLEALSVERVNTPPLWSLVVCRRGRSRPPQRDRGGPQM
jgi:phosphatidylethanolamine/phosphatidyl-N-methylethanolamine N-methyltransferase